MLVAEDLKGLKHKSKLSTRFLNRMQYWNYKQVLTKLELRCQEHGIQMVKVSPAYTSQTCSKCGNVDRDSRKGERFMCTACAFELDADINAAINIHNRGAYVPSDKKRVTYNNNLEEIYP
jgi:transposase